MIIEVRFHGRGGQGVVLASALLAKAAFYEGKFTQAIPFFGAERRGAPVVAYTRISDVEIHIKSGIHEPDIVVVLDPKILSVIDVFSGLKEDGIAVLNTKEKVKRSTSPEKFKVATVDASGIAYKLGLIVAGIPVVNTAVLGALVKATSLINLQSLLRAINDMWEGAIADKNVKAAETAFNETFLEVG